MQDISYNNFESTAYDGLYEVINNRSYIPDPRGSTTRTMVYDADPILTKGLGFNGFPYIILELPLLEYDRPSADGRFRDIKFKWKIVIRTARDGSANTRTDAGRSDILALGDALQKTLNGMTARASLNTAGLNQFILVKTSTDIVIIDQKQLYEAVYTLETFNRFQITA